MRQHGEAALAPIPGMTPHGRVGLPEDIAAVIAALCGEDCAWIHGQVVYANGGSGPPSPIAKGPPESDPSDPPSSLGKMVGATGFEPATP